MGQTVGDYFGYVAANLPKSLAEVNKLQRKNQSAWERVLEPDWGYCQEFLFLDRYASCTPWLSFESVHLNEHPQPEQGSIIEQAFWTAQGVEIL